MKAGDIIDKIGKFTYGLLTGIALTLAVLGLRGVFDTKAQDGPIPNKHDMISPVIEVFRDEIDKTLNGPIFFAIPKDQASQVSKLIKMREIIRNFNYSNMDNKYVLELVDIVDTLVIAGDWESAIELSDRLAGRTINLDPFVRSRSLAIKACLLGMKQPIRANVDVENDLKEALSLDSKNSLAYSGLGCELGKKAINAGISEASLNAQVADSLFHSAILHFEMAEYLNPSKPGLAAFINNELVTRLYFVNDCILNDCDTETISKYSGANTVEEYFRSSYEDIRKIKSLFPHLAGGIETEAQLLSVEASYNKKNDEDENAEKLSAMATDRYIDAINTGLFRYFETNIKAKKYFREDRLVSNLNKNKILREIIETTIDYYFENR